jgi:hypothetical protein
MPSQTFTNNATVTLSIGTRLMQVDAMDFGACLLNVNLLVRLGQAHGVVRREPGHIWASPGATTTPGRRCTGEAKIRAHPGQPPGFRV